MSFEWPIHPLFSVEPTLYPFSLTHTLFVRFLTLLSSENLRMIYHSLFCEVELIRENNKHNSLSMKPSIF